ncbi:phosphotransferase [Gephyromycinifex aptenodytis]|uniref:phosphotransferase n=1 Tax=Gephyromycinifex aptenodytis TaxID=2716227 RepID=UPI00144885AE|nr:phosphotransferase [Gephyromycinifex aptenodytis]
MPTTPAVLAALADAAVQGLLPERVRGALERIGNRHHVGFIEDSRGRHWVVRLPVDAVSAARQDASVALLEMLPRHLPFDVPEPAGFAALPDGRRAMVYPYLPGCLLDFTALPAGPGLTRDIGRALAALHDLDPRVVEEAGLPVYEAEECRRRLQGEVERGAQTGLVPAGLLNRWQRLLENQAWWEFTPSVVHGYIANRHLLATWEDARDAAEVRLSALLGWEGATVGDPAEDLASFSRALTPEACETLFSAYLRARRASVDTYLIERAQFLGELRVLSRLLQARGSQDRDELAQASQHLQRLDDLVGDETRGDRPTCAADGVPVQFDADPIDGQWYSSDGDPGTDRS